MTITPIFRTRLMCLRVHCTSSWRILTTSSCFLSSERRISSSTTDGATLDHCCLNPVQSFSMTFSLSNSTNRIQI